jgi:hypothetical protein
VFLERPDVGRPEGMLVDVAHRVVRGFQLHQQLVHHLGPRRA